MEKKISFRTVCQKIFLTCVFFGQNDLFSYASSCAFGLLFSFFPVVIMTFSFLIRVLKASPEMLYPLLKYENMLPDYVNLENIIQSFLQFKGSVFFEFIVGISLIWLARRFFNFMLKSFKCIFHSETQRKPFMWQIFMIAGEILLVFILASLVFIFITSVSLFDTEFLRQIIPSFVQNFVYKILRFAPGILMFFFITIAYKFGSGTNPSGFLCMVNSGLCTTFFFLFLKVFSLIVDMPKYNLIYGIMGNTFVILFEIFIFFILFLFFAQMIYIHQFFDQLLLAELYLLPNKSDLKPMQALRRAMFIKPDYFIRNESVLISLPVGSVIFEEGNESKDVYYLAEGIVNLSSRNRVNYCVRGEFFGELSSVIRKPRESTAIASTDVKIIRIQSEIFTSMLEKNPIASRKVLSQFSEYFSFISKDI